MTPNEYECDYCHGVFEKGKSEESALAEMKLHFGYVPEEYRAIVCDKCWKKMMLGPEFAVGNN